MRGVGDNDDDRGDDGRHLSLLKIAQDGRFLAEVGQEKADGRVAKRRHEKLAAGQLQAASEKPEASQHEAGGEQFIEWIRVRGNAVQWLGK